jgi:PAS domain S-box-containing protein
MLMSKVAVESANEVYVDLCKDETIKVLHVDDEAGFLVVAKQCLEENGKFQVDTALSAKEALEKLKRSDYDVIVCDYQMRGKNGLELLRKLRQRGDDTPFILFTCKGKEDIAIEALNSGVYRYIGKEGNAEVTYEELKSSICDAVRGQRTEKLLKEAENRLRLITDNMQDMLILTDMNLVCTYASASHKWILGYEPREIVGKKVYDFIHPDDLTKAMEAATQAFKNNSEGKLEVRVKRADGSYILSEGIGKILTDEKGQITGTVLTSREITERKRIEQALKESEEKYRKLFDGAMDAIFVADAETGIIVDCNHAATELIGRAKSEIIGAHQRFLHLPQERARKFTETFEQHRTDKEGIAVEDKIITKDGEIRDVTIKGNLIEINDKKMLQGIFRDVTESKKIFDKNRFQSRLLNSVGQAIIATDKNGKIIYWNHAAKQLYGWQEAEVIGRSIVEVTPAEVAQEQAVKIMKRLTAGEYWSGEFLAKRRDGTLFPAIVTTAPITNDKGELIGTIGVSTDISEQKWMQEVLNEAIEKVVELNEKLHVVESLTRHDIRNKLSALNGRIYLLKKRLKDNPEALTHLKEMELASQQILKIMEFEKNYVQVGSEELKNTDVERYVSEAALLFSDLKGSKLINECSGLTVLADSMLRQLLYNMIDNTLKYGEKTTTIRVHYKEEKDKLKLIYEDDGVGISDEEKGKLFQEGYGKGTGFGLYLIKRICEGYGWKIQETGKHGEGVQFTMTIPKKAKDGINLYEIN